MDEPRTCHLETTVWSPQVTLVKHRLCIVGAWAITGDEEHRRLLMYLGRQTRTEQLENNSKVTQKHECDGMVETFS